MKTKLLIAAALIISIGAYAKSTNEEKATAAAEKIQEMKIEALLDQYQLKVFYGIEKKTESGAIDKTEFIGFTTSSNYTIVEKAAQLENNSQYEEFYYDTKGQLIAYVFQNSPDLNTVFLTEGDTILAVYQDEIVDTPFGKMEVVTLTEPLKKQCLLASKEAKKTYNSIKQLRK